MTIDFYRDDWGAPSNTAPSINTPTDLLFLHHSVTPQWRGADAARRLERIARGRGFNHGYSYSCGATHVGDSHEGRGGGRAQAATRGYNRRSHSIVLVGNFDEHPLPDALVEEVAQLVAHGHRAGWWPDHITHPHSAVSSTACPGRYARAAIPRINARARQILAGQDETGEDELAGISKENQEWLDAMASNARARGVRTTSLGYAIGLIRGAIRQTGAHHQDLDVNDADQVGVTLAHGANSGHRVNEVAGAEGLGLAEWVRRTARHVLAERDG